MKVAIVEDDKKAADLLCKYLEQFNEEYGEKFSIQVFGDAVSFLASYKALYDIVFMDIEMPDMNGMEASAKLRAIDSTVTLIFVTNMAQYAVKGYEVSALDFIVKPVTYANFAIKLRRAIENVKHKKGYKLKVVTGDSVTCVDISDLVYIEVMNHRLVYHTLKKDIVSYGQLKKLEESLSEKGFAKCNSCYLVNMKYVTAVNGFSVTVGDRELSVSHARKKAFMKELADYLGGVGI